MKQLQMNKEILDKLEEVISNQKKASESFTRHEKEEFSMFDWIKKEALLIWKRFNEIEDKVNNHDLRINSHSIAIGGLVIIVVLLLVKTFL